MRLINDKTLSLDLAVQSVSDDFKEIDETFDSIKRDNICRKIYSRTKIFFLAFATSIFIELAFNLASYVFDDIKFSSVLFSNGLFLYYGLLVMISFFALMVLSEFYDFMYLFVQKIVFSIIIFIIVLIAGLDGNNITSYYGKILMFDDFEYYDYGVTDSDPLWGNDYSGYIGEYQFFLPLNYFENGSFKKDNLEFRYDGYNVELIKSDWETYTILRAANIGNMPIAKDIDHLLRLKRLKTRECSIKC